MLASSILSDAVSVVLSLTRAIYHRQHAGVVARMRDESVLRCDGAQEVAPSVRASGNAAKYRIRGIHD
jgi:hypothetical protein